MQGDWLRRTGFSSQPVKTPWPYRRTWKFILHWLRANRHSWISHCKPGGRRRWKRDGFGNLSGSAGDCELHLLGDAGFDPVYGARPLKRAIQSQLENPLAQEILAGRFGPGSTVKVDAEGDQLVFAAGAEASASVA